MPPVIAGFTPVLVDSSLWVQQLRKGGDPVKRERVNALLRSGVAAWCPLVRLELWRGVTNDGERATLRRYEALLPEYEMSPPVWERAIRLADRGRAAGVTVPLADLLIFACASVHELEIAHDDAHFEALAKLPA
jgi:predicted nucleic acid-binding protein